jgi:hypothetical protein
LGAPGEKNNVFVGVDNTLATPGETNSAAVFDADAKLSGSQSVVMLKLTEFAKNDLGNSGLAGALGHEGTHVADAQAEAARLKGTSSGDLFDLASNGGIMSRAITEVHAYRVSAYVAAAINPSNVESSSFNGYQIWNRGWRAADADRLRERGIRGVLQSPTGSYRYNYSPAPIPLALPLLNNALDLSSRWTVNGGPILK